MTRKGRRLSPEEERLWQKTMSSTTPLDAKARLHPERKVKTNLKNQSAKPALTSFRIGERSGGDQPATRISPPDQPLRMDQKTYARMKRGKTSPEGRIDLHGMTVDVAHSALRAFLLRSHSEGKRLVLVITGKGKSNDVMAHSDAGRGILRRQVPHWLELPPLRQIVLQTTPAHQRHGGSGAFYVYLRR